jgi:hypothetical protein
MWNPQVNAVLGSVVVTIGLWLLWGDVPIPALVAVALGVAGMLAWRCATVGAVWAWTTLLLGLESFAFPIATMIQIRMTTAEPSQEQMGQMLTAILFGVFSSIFWLTFSYGVFKKLKSRTNEGKPAPG